MRRTYHELPEAVVGYELAAFDIAVVKPRSATNLVSNPSVEQATTGYTAVGGSIARVATQQRRGAYSLQVTPTSGTGDGVYYGTVSLSAGTGYFLALDILGAPGVPYKLYFATTGGAQLGTAFAFRGTGRWQRVWVFWQETSTTTRRLYLTKDNHASTRPFYIDGLQCEADERTTYFDGASRGFVRGQTAYYWTGTEHASPSVRVLQTRSGGTEVKLRDLGFYVTAVLGLGLNGVSNITLPNAYIGGSTFQRTEQVEYTFDLAGSFMADSLAQLQQQRRDLIAALRPNAGILQQPLLLKVQVTDDCGQPTSEPVEIECLYAGGLQGNLTNYFQEQATLTFTTFLPYAARLDGGAGASIAYEDTFTAAYHAALINGDWQAISTGFDNQVLAIAIDEQRGRVYFGGVFNVAGGVTVNKVGYWDIATQTFVAMDGGVGGFNVSALALDAAGNVWVGGFFTTVGSGAAATKSLARWNVAAGTWTAFNNAATTMGGIEEIEVDTAGNVYIAGNFTNWDSNANCDHIAMYNGSVWSALGTGIQLGAGTGVLALLWSNGYLYAGGDFATAGGVAGTLNIARWDGSAWTAMGLIGANSTVLSFLAMPDSSILVGGDFTALGTFALNRFGIWKNDFFSALGQGVNGALHSLTLLPNSTVLLGGQFTTAGGLATADRVAIWNGSTFLPLDIDLPSTPIVYASATLRDDLYLGFNTTGTATIGGLTTITNPGSADGYPVVTFTGPGRLDKLKNYTTGDVLAFDLTLLAGEVAVLNLTPSHIAFGSNFRPNLLGTILPGSTLATFRLAPGPNRLRLYITGDDANTAVALAYQPAYASLDDALYD